MKKGLKCLVVASVLISGSLALNAPSALAADSTSVIEDIGKGAKVINRKAIPVFDKNKNIKHAIEVSFIDDPLIDKKYAVISTDGSSINANMKVYKPGYYNASLKWPSAYKTKLELTDQDSVSFYKIAPVNTIDIKKVSSTVSYNVGGSLNVKADSEGKVTGSAGISGGASWSSTISYDQPDYKTVVESNTDKKVEWRVGFVGLENQGWGIYDRDSYNDLYGNQLLMKNRAWNVAATDNFLPEDKMPSLTAYSFQPGTVAIAVAEKGESSTNLKVTHTRVSDDYTLNWVGGIKWWGTNEKDKFIEESVKEYKIDWTNNSVEYIE